MIIASDTDISKIRIIATWTDMVQCSPDHDVVKQTYTKSFSQDATVKEIFEWWQRGLGKQYIREGTYIESCPLSITVDEATINEFKEDK